MYDFTFQKQPVHAFRLPWKISLHVNDRPKPFDAPWLVVNADGSMHLLIDETFRRLYHPTTDGARAYLESQEKV